MEHSRLGRNDIEAELERISAQIVDFGQPRQVAQRIAAPPGRAVSSAFSRCMPVTCTPGCGN
jgi:hypothetical protein